MKTLQGIKGTYILENTIGSTGKFGGVCIGYRQKDKLAISVKKLNKRYPRNPQLIATIQRINHPNIAKTIEVFEANDSFYIVREYYQGTNLKTIIKNGSIHKKLGEHFLLKCMIQLLKGLEELHKNHILHLDIKPANIIIKHSRKTPPQQWNSNDVVLIDFEQAVSMPVFLQRSPFSLIYSPPEQLLNQLHLANVTSDIFAFSITLFELIARKAPYEDCNAEILLNLQLAYPVKKRPSMDDDLFTIIEKGCYKAIFPKPPRLLDRDTIIRTLQEGMQGRYQTVMEIRCDLEKYVLNLKEEPKKSWLKQLFT